MSIEYCEKCGNRIDTDYDSEHFGEDGEGCEYDELDYAITTSTIKKIKNT